MRRTEIYQHKPHKRMNHFPSAKPFDLDLLRYAEGSLSDDEMKIFQARLAAEPALRNDLRNLSEQAFAIGVYARNAEAISEIKNRSVIIALPQKSRSSWQTHLSWAAAVLVMSVVLFFSIRKSSTRPQPIALLEVMEVIGTASWISEDGARTVILQKGMFLPAGALELASQSGFASFRYDDGTMLSFTGISEATITQKSGKFLSIKRGQLTAKVSKQDSKAAMRIKTPTAQVTVLGTHFSLDVEEEQTGLGVFEGMVRMRRSSDGQEQNVPTGLHLTSTLDDKAEFIPTAPPAAQDAWTSDFTRMPDIDQGEWTPPSLEHPDGAIIAKAFVADRKPDGSIITHYGIILKSEQGFTTLDEDSILRMKVRVQTTAAIQLMLSTRMPDGTYTGNFEAKAITLTPTANGAWKEIEIPVSHLKSLKSTYPEIPSGTMAYAFIITSYQEDEGLEIAQISTHKKK
jgi:ferric-dicitrate binding protein FerR (iron transport regulator)